MLTVAMTAICIALTLVFVGVALFYALRGLTAHIGYRKRQSLANACDAYSKAALATTVCFVLILLSHTVRWGFGGVSSMLLALAIISLFFAWGLATTSEAYEEMEEQPCDFEAGRRHNRRA
jgi:hypothetical protein